MAYQHNARELEGAFKLLQYLREARSMQHEDRNRMTIGDRMRAMWEAGQ